MQVKHTINPTISEDTEGREVLLGLNADTALSTLTGFTSAASDARDLALADGPYTVPFSGGVQTGKGFFLRSTADFDLEVNGSQKFQVRRGALDASSFAPNCKVLMECDVTSLIVTPLADGRLIWAVWGDVTA